MRVDFDIDIDTLIQYTYVYDDNTNTLYELELDRTDDMSMKDICHFVYVKNKIYPSQLYTTSQLYVDSNLEFLTKDEAIKKYPEEFLWL